MRFWRAIAVAFMLALVSGTAAAEPRIALVIGNAGYDARLGPLANPVNDANAIAAALRATGFEVELVTDVDQRGMRRAISRFGERLDRAGSTATGLFFYAGHGLQSRGINYLAPIGAEIAREADIEIEAVAADTVLRQMDEARIATSILILDACRNTPVLRSFRSGSSGLAPMEAPGGAYIAYSTAPGQTATDGSETNSPFAAALAREIVVPSQPIEVVFRNVRSAVLTVTGGQQRPWDASSLTVSFSFVPATGPAAPAGGPAVTLQVAAAPQAAAAVAVRGIQARDFSTVPTASAPDLVVAAQPYLRDGALLLRAGDLVPSSSELVFQNNRVIYGGRAVSPLISQNLLTQRNTGNVAASFTLVLPRPASKVHFMIPRLFPDSQSGVTFPAWTATALSAGGDALDSRSRAVARRFETDIPHEVITLQAPAFEGIAAIRFQSDPRLRNTAGELVPFAAFSAILIEGIWIEPMGDGSP